MCHIYVVLNLVNSLDGNSNHWAKSMQQMVACWPEIFQKFWKISNKKMLYLKV